MIGYTVKVFTEPPPSNAGLEWRRLTMRAAINCADLAARNDTTARAITVSRCLDGHPVIAWLASEGGGPLQRVAYLPGTDEEI